MPKLSDVEWIYVVLAVFYCIELLTWVRPGVHAFTTRWGSFRNRRSVMRLTGNENGSLILGGLTPSDGYLLADPTSRDSDPPADAFDIQATRDRVEQWFASTRMLRRFAWLLTFWMGPVGISLYYGWLPVDVDDVTTYTYLGILLLIWWTTSVLIFMAHRRLYPNDKAARFKLAAYTAVSPVVPLRGADYLSRPLVTEFHPITVSAAIDDASQFRDFAAKLLRETHHCAAKADGESALEGNIRRVIEQCEIDPRDLLSAPEPEDTDSLSYCPRCLQQFEITDATCDQCDGFATVAFVRPSSKSD